MKENARPLSPHLQVYKPQMTSMLSILHRATGVALVAGLILVAAILISAATGEEAYNTVMGYVGTTLGQLALIGWSFAIIYHLMNGIRHLIWDTGRMFNISCATKAGYVVFWGAVVLTAALWITQYNKATPLTLYKQAHNEACTETPEAPACQSEE